MRRDAARQTIAMREKQSSEQTTALKQKGATAAALLLKA
jgi:hypothetical protein